MTKVNYNMKKTPKKHTLVIKEQLREFLFSSQRTIPIDEAIKKAKKH